MYDLGISVACEHRCSPKKRLWRKKKKKKRGGRRWEGKWVVDKVGLVGSLVLSRKAYIRKKLASLFVKVEES